MNEYEGLNLPQLLELMHELVMPAPISRFPEGPGWWVLGAWLLAIVAIFVRAFLAYRRRTQYRRDADALLDAIAAVADKDPADAAVKIAVVLKQAALAAYPREQVASLYGEAWADFLCRSASNDPVVAGASSELASAAYRRDADGRQLIKPAKRWIQVHRA
jgi:hypothetical protein